MSSVELRPGDTLNIVWTAVQETPLGKKEVESSFAFTYDELLTKLRSKGHAGKSRRSGTEGARFSRVIALSTNALRKAKWSTGADIDRNEVFEKLITQFNALEEGEYKNVTANAKKALVALYKNGTYLSSEQKEALKASLTHVDIDPDKQ